MTHSAHSIQLWGTPEPEPEPLVLEAGPLQARFEPGTAFLRDIQWHGVPALMGIYAALRDHNWGTVTPQVSNVAVQRSPEQVVLTFLAVCRRENIDFSWHGRILLDATGRVEYAFEGRAASAFCSNRIGFCVLHAAADCAGRSCRITHTSGECTDARFPETISPYQPCTDIRTIAQVLDNGASCEVSFSGDVFEMEDQRNWSDASYKTYCTPLARPFPVPIHPNDPVRQTVTVDLGRPTRRRRPRPPRAPGDPARIRPHRTQARKMPLIGHGLTGESLSAADRTRVKRWLRPDFVRCTAEVGVPQWLDRLALAQARALDTPVDLALCLGAAATEEMAAVADCVRRSGSEIRHWLVLSAADAVTQPDDVTEARRVLGPLTPAAGFGLGTRGNFAELNRGRPPEAGATSVSFALAVEVHAADRATILENIHAAAWTVQAAQALYPGLEIRVGPAAFRQQFNPVATAADSAQAGLPDSVDPRQLSLFGAGFTLGIIGSLAAAGAAALTIFDIAGMNGTLEGAEAPPRPEEFPSIPGRVYPLFHVLADLREMAQATIVPCTVDGRPEVPVVLCETRGMRRLLLANPGPEPLAVHLPPADRPCRLRQLDESNLDEALAAPDEFRQPTRCTCLAGNVLELPAWAYVSVTEGSTPT